MVVATELGSVTAGWLGRPALGDAPTDGVEGGFVVVGGAPPSGSPEHPARMTSAHAIAAPTRPVTPGDPRAQARRGTGRDAQIMRRW